MNHEKGFNRRRLALITVFFVVLMALSLAVGGCGEQMARMEDSQVRLQAMVAANARQLATISSQLHANAGDIQQGIEKLDQNDQSLTAEVMTAQNDQARLQETVTNGNRTMNERMTRLDENQQLLQEGVTQVAGVTQRTASNVTAIAKEHAALHRMVQDNKQTLLGQMATVTDNQQTIQTEIGQLHQADQCIVGQLTVMGNKQETLHKALDDNKAHLAGRLDVLADDQNQLRNDVRDVYTLTDAVATRASQIADDQAVLQAALQTQSQTLAERIAIVTESQQNLQTVIDRVANTTTTTATDVTALAADHSNIHKTLETNHAIVTGQVAAVIGNQEDIQIGIDDLAEKTDQGATRLAALDQRVEANHQTVAAKLTGLSDRQTRLHSDVGRLQDRATALASDVTTVKATQTALRETVKAGNEVFADQVTSLAQQQQAIRTGMTNLSDKADALAAGMTAHRSLVADNTALSREIISLSENQQTVGTQLANLDEKTDRLATDITSLANTQGTMQQTLQTQGEAVNDQMTNLATNQRSFQDQFDTLTVTTGQVALDVIAMGDTTNQLAAGLNGLAGEQTALAATLKRHDENVSEQMIKVANEQEQIGSGLETVTATAGQTALEIVDIGNRQAQLQQTVQANRQELAARLADIAQGQQQWRERFDAAQTNVETMTAGISALEQRVTTLQGTLQASLENATTLLDADSQDRLQFEANVNRDIQAMIDAVSQLREIQASLQEQIQQIQRNTQMQADDIISAIEQLSARSAELKVSSAVTELEPSLPDVAK